jgi:hypothetical protein
MILNYNIHNLFKFKVVSSNKGFLSYIDREFSFFKTKNVKNPDLIIFINNFKPDVKNTSIVNHKYFIKKNFLFCEDSYKVVKWKVQIDGIEEKETAVNFYGNFFSKSFLVSYIIEPLMRFKLEKKGYTFIHSSAISNGEESVLFFACKGVGKTSTILNLIDKGFLYMSDDFTIISNKGIVYSYPTTIHIFGYNIKQCPFLYKKLPFRNKININLKGIILNLSFKYASLPLNINVKDVFSNSEIGNSYPLKELIFFVKSTNEKVKFERNYNKEDIVNQIISINKLETFNFLDYMLSYASIFPKSDFALHWSRSYKNLMRALDKKQITKITIPTKFSDKILDYILPRLTHS